MTIFGVGIPLSDIACVMGIYFIFLTRSSADKALIYILLVSCLLSILVNTIFINRDFSTQPFLSLAYFIRPIAVFFVGYNIIRSGVDLDRFIKYFSVVFSIFIIAVFANLIIYYGGVVRTDGILNGTFFALNIFGTYGVHSLVAFYFLGFSFVLSRLFFCYSAINVLWRSIYVVVILIVLYFFIFSLSREIIVGLLFFSLLIFRKYILRSRLFLKYCFAVIILIYIAYAILPLDLILSTWDTRFSVTLDSINNGSLDDLSSGRIELYRLAINQILSNPLFGNGFFGFQLYNISFGQYDDLTGWSPHNYYLTVIWKMGFIAASVYFLFFYRGLKRFYVLTKFFPKYLPIWWALLTFLVVINQVWDAFLVPNVLSIIMFLFGATTSILERTSREHVINYQA